MISLLQIQRARLELDQTLRARAFFARAITGTLDDADYAALVLQLTELLAAASGSAADGLRAQARKDLDALERRIECPPCPAVKLFAGAATSHRLLLPNDVAFDVAAGLAGTSWTRDAARRRGRRGARFLDALADAGDASMQRLRQRFAEDYTETEYAVAFGELARGALLGVASWLDSSCPAPIVVATLETIEETNREVG